MDPSPLPSGGRGGGHRAPLAAAGLATLSLTLAACVGAHGVPRPATSVAGRAAAGWPHFGNTLGNTRYSPLTQVTTANVGRLRRVWTRSEGLDPALWEDYPVVVGGTMYLTTSTDQVLALAAASGRVRWTFTPVVNFFLPGAGSLVLPTNRGVAVWDGRVYLTTFDDRLIALRAATGRELWQRSIASPSAGYVETGAPTVAGGVVYVGDSSEDTGVRGFVAAFDATTGAFRWRFYTVPAPGHGWVPARGHHGGGDVWMPPTIDPSRGRLYVATGNPTPDLVPSVRPGCDPHVDSTIALDAATGRLLWAHQEVCPDAWDYDTDQPPMYFTLRRRGRRTEVVGDASKSGTYTVMNAATGAVVSRSPFLTPYTVPHPLPTGGGVTVCPGAFGGIEYSPASYSPRTGAVYQDGVRACMRYTAISAAAAGRHRAGQPDTGGAYTLLPTPAPAGYLAAIVAASGRVLWQDPLPAPSVGGTLATAGGLVFTGDDNGHLYAVAARTGRVLWAPDVGLPFGSAPITYAVAGRQYVAVVAGGSQLAVLSGTRTGGELVVFALPARRHRPRRGGSGPAAGA